MFNTLEYSIYTQVHSVLYHCTVYTVVYSVYISINLYTGIDIIIIFSE